MVEVAPNAHGDVKLGGDGLACEAHLSLPWHPAHVGNIAGTRDRRAYGLCQLGNRGHVFRSADALAHSHYDPRALQLHALDVHVQVPFHQFHVRVGSPRCRHMFDECALGPVGFDGSEKAGTHGSEVGFGLRVDGSHHVAPQGGLHLHQLHLIVDFQVDAVAREAKAQPGSHAGSYVSPVRIGLQQHGVGLTVQHQAC